jgi:hypothetical protein
MDDLLVENEEIKGRIAGFRAQLETLADNDDKHLRLQLKIARLELEINGYQIQFNKALADGINLLSLGPLLETIRSTSDNLDKLLAQEQRPAQTQPAGHSILFSHSHSSVY